MSRKARKGTKTRLSLSIFGLIIGIVLIILCFCKNIPSDFATNSILEVISGIVAEGAVIGLGVIALSLAGLFETLDK